MRGTSIKVALAVSVAGLANSAGAAPLSVRDSFRIGNAGTIFCSAQSLAADPALASMFDSGYALTCRDAALPIGKVKHLILRDFHLASCSHLVFERRIAPRISARIIKT